MAYDCIRCETGRAVALITLSRPQVTKAMNRQLWIEFQDALKKDIHDTDANL